MNEQAEDGNRLLIFFVLGHSLPKSLPEVQKHGRWERHPIVFLIFKRSIYICRIIID